MWGSYFVIGNRLSSKSRGNQSSDEKGKFRGRKNSNIKDDGGI